MLPGLCSVISVVKLTSQQYILTSRKGTSRKMKHSKQQKIDLENLHTVLEHSFNSRKHFSWKKVIENSDTLNLRAGIATRYGLNGTGIETQQGDIFGPGANAASYITGYCRGLRRRGCGFNHPYPSKAQGKERAEIYLYPPSVPSQQVTGRNLPF